eukprot:TRINITY_DN10471_c0_g2_i1.p1 TRINITY_DN10471_c0_g2~~TRINITY_DN10471_c0_g2_i1.p1  ORF type:complete len:3481 (+),score=1349.73 TRINITY_DN10471_c0_g2_i1:148-10590(+)
MNGAMDFSSEDGDVKRSGSRAFRKEAAGMCLTERLEDVYGSLKRIEFSANRYVTWWGVALDVLQNVAFAFTPHYRWDDVSNFVGQAVYSFQLPIWDHASILSLGGLDATVLFWTGVVLVLSVWAGMGAVHMSNAEQQAWVWYFAGYAAFIGSALLLPLLQLFVSVMMVRSDPHYEQETKGYYEFPVSLLATVLLCGLAIIVNVFHGDINPKSKSKVARAHSHMDLASLAYKLTTTVLFQYFIITGMHRWYCLYLALASFALGCGYVVFQPYFIERVTFFRVLGCWLTTFFAAYGGLLEIKGVQDALVGSPNFGLLVTVVGVAAAAAVSQYFYLFRRSRTFQQHLHDLTFDFKRHTPVPGYPQGLPDVAQEESFLTTLQARTDPSELASTRKTQESAVTADDAEEFHLYFPYVDTVMFETDCELACRFLRFFVKHTSSQPTSEMLKEAERIYNGSVHVFPDSPTVLLSFAAFLIYYKKSFAEARMVLDRISKTDASLVVRYRVFKLALLLKTDSTQLEHYKRAKIYHRDCLERRIDFWRTLCPEEVDRMQLNGVSQTICELSESSLSGYLAAIRVDDTDKQIHKSDIRMIAHYGMFFQHVYMNDDLADRCYNVAQDMIKNREQKAMRGARKGMTDNGIGQIPTRSELRQLGNTKESGGGNSIVQAVRMLNVVFATLVLLMSSFLLLSHFSAVEQARVVRSVSSVGRAHSNALQSLVLIEQITAAENPSPSYEAQQRFDEENQLVNSQPQSYAELKDMTESFHSNLNAFLWGKLSPSDDTLNDYLTDSLFYVSDHQSDQPENMLDRDNFLRHNGNFQSLWVLCYRIAQNLYGVINAPPSEAQYTNPNYQFLAHSVPSELSSSLNRTLTLYDQWYMHSIGTSRMILYGIFGTNTVLIGAVLVALLVKFNAVEETEEIIRNVVNLIPKNTIQTLLEEARETLHKFDHYIHQPEVMLSREIMATQQSGVTDDKEGDDLYDQFGNLRTLTGDHGKAADNDERDDQPDMDALAKRETVDNEEQQRNREAMLPLKASLMIVILCILGGIFMAVVQLPELAATQKRFESEDLRVLEDHIASDLTDLGISSALFVLNPHEKAYYDRFYAAVSRTTINPALKRAWIEYSESEDFTRSIQAGFVNIEALVRKYVTGMRLAVEGVNQNQTVPVLSLDEHDYLRTAQWNRGRVSLLGLPHIPFEPLLYGELTTPEVDLARQDVNLTQLAQSYAFSAYANNIAVAVEHQWSDIFHRAREVNADLMGASLDRALVLFVGELIFMVLLLLSVLSVLAFGHRIPGAGVSKEKMISLSTMAIFALGICILCSLAMQDIEDARREYKQMGDCIERGAALATMMEEGTVAALSFAEQGHLFFQSQFSQTVQKLPAMRAKDAALADSDETQEALNLAWDNLVDYMKLLEIVVLMGRAAWGTDPALLRPMFGNVGWSMADYTLFPRHTQADYERHPERFVNTSHDAALGRAGLITRAEGVIEYLYRDISVLTHKYSDAVMASERCVTDHTRLDGLFTGIYVRFSADLVMLALAFLLILKFIQAEDQKTHVQEDSDDATGGEGKRKVEARQMGTQIKKTVYALACVMALVAGIFVVSHVKISSSELAVQRLGTASSREWLVAKSMLLSEQVLRLVVEPSPGEAAPRWLDFDAKQTELLQTIGHLEEANAKLYFFETGSGQDGFNGVGVSNQQDMLLFGAHAEQRVPSRYAVDAASQCPEPLKDGTSARDELQHGLHSAMEKWAAFANELAQADREAVVLSMELVQKMRASFVPLMDSLVFSTELYKRSANSAISSTTVWVGVAVAIAVVLTLLDFFAVFRPITNALTRDEQTTRMILKLLPNSVSDNVDTDGSGTRSNNDANMQVGDAVVQMSPLPLITIDHNGIMLKFSSQAVKEQFGYTAVELTGANVKILMPEEYSVNHDQYLANYRRTGIKKIIDTTRSVKARKKNGKEFPVDVMVREFVCAGEVMFIGFIRSQQQELLLRAATARNEVIQKLNVNAVLTVDTHGLVMNANQSARDMFGYNTETHELKGRNIKSIMPPEIAANHDKYLDDYLRTGVRTMIGTLRKQRGQRRNGNIFPLEAKIEEVKCDPPVYVGYLRDISSDEDLANRFRMNDAVANLSTISIVSIDKIGTILKFSQASEKMFGCTQQQALGKNIKSFMPLSVASHHDDYLATYMRTKVKHVIGSTRESEARRHDGSLFPVSVSVQEVDHSLRVTFIGFLEDLTLQKQIMTENLTMTKVNSSSPAGIVTADEIGTILSANESMLQLLGHPRPRDVVGHNLREFMPKRFAEKHDDYLATYKRTRVKHVIDSTRMVYALRSDGEEVPITIKVGEVVNANGPSTYLGFVISGEEAVEVKTGFEVNKAVLSVSHDAVVLINAFGIILQFSEAASKITGYPADEIVGQNIKVIQPPQVAAHHDGYLRTYAKTGVKHVIDSEREVTSITKDGLEFPCKIRIAEVIAGEEKVFVGYVLSHTRQLNAEKTAHLVQELKKVLPLPSLTITTLGVVKDYNEAAEHLFGHKVGNVIGKNVKMLMPEETAREHDGYLTRFRQSDKPLEWVKRRVQGQAMDGKEFTLELFLFEAQFYGESIQKEKLIIGYANDVTQLVQYEQVSKNVDKVNDLSSTAVMTINSGGLIMKFSKAAGQLFGATPEEMIGLNINVLMPDPHKTNHNRYLLNYKKHGVKHVIDTTLAVTAQKYKSTTPVHIELSVFEHITNNTTVFIGFAIDLSSVWKVETAIKQAEAIDHLSDFPMIIMDTRCMVQSANRATCQLFGYTLKEIQGKNVNMLMPPRTAEQHDGFIKRYLDTGIKRAIGTTTKLVAMKESGQEFPVELRVETLDTDAGLVFVGSLKDTTDDIANEKMIKVNMAMGDFSTDPLLMIDAHGTVQLFSTSACKAFGYTLEEVMGKNVKMLTPDDIAPNHDGFLERYRRTGEKKVIDNQVRLMGRRKDGTLFPVVSALKELRLNNEVLIFGFLQDVRQEMMMRQEKAVAQNVISWSSVPIISIRPNGIVTSFNEAAVLTFQYDSSAVIGENVKMLMDPSLAKNHDGFLERYMKTGKKNVIGRRVQQSAYTSNGAKLPVELSVEEFGDAQNRYFVAYVKNITEKVVLDYTSKVMDTMTELSPLSIILINTTGVIMQFSRAGEREFGFKAENIIGKNVSMLMPDNHAVKHDTYLKRYLRTGLKKVIGKGGVRDGIFGKRADGSTFPMELMVQEIQKEGMEQMFIGCLRDFSEQLRMLDNTEVSKASLAASFLPLIIIDVVGTVQNYSESTAEVFGWTEAEVLGKNVKMLQPKETSDQHDWFLRRYVEDRQKRVVDTTRTVTAKHKNGVMFQVELNVLEIEADGVVFYLSYVRDLTVDKNLAWEAQLAEVIAYRYEDPLVTVDVRSNILRFNKAAENTFQFGADQVMGKNIRLLMPDDISAVHESFVQKYLNSNAPQPLRGLRRRRVTAETKEGDSILCFISILELREEGSDPTFTARFHISEEK